MSYTDVDGNDVDGNGRELYEPNPNKPMNAQELAVHFAEQDLRYFNHRLLLVAICRGKAVYAFNGFVVYGAGWIAVEFDEEGLPILTEKITKALEATR